MTFEATSTISKAALQSFCIGTAECIRSEHLAKALLKISTGGPCCW